MSDEREQQGGQFPRVAHRSIPHRYPSSDPGENIGEGTFGKVKLGVHMHTGQRVAIKTLQKEKIVEQADIERVTREICILKILRHPNIIQLY